jgi:hypothetical protein
MPLWRRISRFVERPSPPPTGPVVTDRPPPGTIRPVVKAEFDRLAARYPYYRGRWDYTSVACDAAGELIDRHGLHSALELGPHIRSIVVGADVMDLRAQPDLQSEGRLLVHNATIKPWPVADAEYGLFVALQVFEHLGDRQAEAFSEVCRVARHAIISLPIDWEMADPTNCHHQISAEQVLAWFLPVVPTRIVVGNDGPKKRLIYVFENLPKPAVLTQPELAEAV